MYVLLLQTSGKKLRGLYGFRVFPALLLPLPCGGLAKVYLCWRCVCRAEVWGLCDALRAAVRGCDVSHHTPLVRLLI